jgi:hypothetical protein
VATARMCLRRRGGETQDTRRQQQDEKHSCQVRRRYTAVHDTMIPASCKRRAVMLVTTRTAARLTGVLSFHSRPS